LRYRNPTPLTKYHHASYASSIATSHWRSTLAFNTGVQHWRSTSAATDRHERHLLSGLRKEVASVQG